MSLHCPANTFALNSRLYFPAMARFRLFMTALIGALSVGIVPDSTGR